MNDTRTIHEPGDTVTLVSRMLFDDDLRREGTVTAVAADGKVTAEFAQPGPFPPLTVTSDAEHFVHVRKAPTPVGYVILNEFGADRRCTTGHVYASREDAAEDVVLSRAHAVDGETFAVCRLVPEADGAAA